MLLNLKSLSVILIAFASCLTVAEGQESKMQSETIAQSNFTTDRAYDYSYCHGGYGVEGEEEGKSAGKNLVVKNSISETGGKPDHCLTATLDTTKIEIPGGASYNYVLWSAGSAMDLATPFKSTDLEGYSVSFDAKISGTESLPSSKLFFNFLVEDDVVAKDDDQNEDIVLSLTRGDDDKGGLIELTNEYQTFTFKLKGDMFANAGSIENLAKFDTKRVAFALQAQGTLEDIGKDADNVLYVDNFKLIKTEKK